MFHFRRFSLRHSRSAQKVGTDGVLLGAWADIAGAHRILDVGTGCGLIALMAAQRCEVAEVTGIDIDAPSVEEARENAAASPFADRISIERADILDYDAAPFDHILSNPPYHTEPLLPPDARRAAARHTADLPLPALINRAAHLLVPGGTLHIILPTAAFTEATSAATACGLRLVRRTDVCTTAAKPPKRLLLAWQRPAVIGRQTTVNGQWSMVNGQRSMVNGQWSMVNDTLTLTAPDGTRTPQHHALTQDFYIS